MPIPERYVRIERFRGEGAFHRMRAHDARTGETVCLLTPDEDLRSAHPEVFVRIRDQVMRAGRVRHPLLVNLLAVEDADGTFCFVTECPEGACLDTVLRERRSRGQPLEAASCMGLAWLICRALDALHPATVHGFLAPHDIYLEPWPSGPLPFYPKVAGAGVRAAMLLAGPAFEPIDEEIACYAAPEMLSAGPVLPQTDVYGVGAILYSVLTLRAPTGCYVRPGGMRDDLPADLDRILLRALDESPSARFAATDELASAIRSAGEIRGGWVALEEALAQMVRPARARPADAPLPVPRAPAPAAATWVPQEPSSPSHMLSGLLVLLLNLGLVALGVGQLALDHRASRGAPVNLPRWERFFGRPVPGAYARTVHPARGVEGRGAVGLRRAGSSA